MQTRFMVLKDGISVQAFDTRAIAESTVKEWEQYHADGRRYAIEERKQPQTIRDIETLYGVASKDRPLLVNGRPFVLVKSDSSINLVEA